MFSNWGLDSCYGKSYLNETRFNSFNWMPPPSYLFNCRYRLSGLLIPGLKEWFESTFGANLQHKTPATVSVDIDILYAYLP